MLVSEAKRGETREGLRELAAQRKEAAPLFTRPSATK
jgi:hypothetical protein